MLNKNLISILSTIILLNSLLQAATYDDYNLSNENNISKETQNNFFMHGNFDQVIRFDKIELDNFKINEDSLSTLQDVIEKTNTYKNRVKKLYVNIIGHSQENSDAIQISKRNALVVQEYLITKGMDKNITSIEYRGAKDPLHLDTFKSLSNRVMVSIYIPMSKDPDNDGIEMAYDKCPNTEPNVVVSKDGCKIKTVIILLQGQNTNSSIVVSTEKNEMLVDEVNQMIAIQSKDLAPEKMETLNEFQLNNLLGNMVNATNKMQKSHVLYFDTVELTEASKQELELILKDLSKSDDHYIKLIGHTDTIGNKTDNLELGYKRVEHILKAIQEKNIKKLTIDKQSYGESNLAIDTKDNTKEILNRRVEIFIH